ncbi:unnamed protein product [Rhizophagus irregularis]|nr:unnamed protein product [Rhizophagus irregularis]
MFAEVSNPIFNATTLNDFTNLQLFLQQQSQILALNEAIRQEKASSSIDCNNPVAISPDYATSTSIPPTPIRASKPSNRWTLAEIRILIKEVGEHQQALQKSCFKERSKASTQQKWDTVFQKYRDIKDTISCTGEEPIQNDWEFYNDDDEYLRNDPSVQDLLQVIQSVITPKRKNRKIWGEKENVIEEFQSFIKEQTATIIEAMDRQHIRTTEIQQNQHKEQMDIFKQFLLKF